MLEGTYNLEISIYHILVKINYLTKSKIERVVEKKFLIDGLQIKRDQSYNMAANSKLRFTYL